MQKLAIKIKKKNNCNKKCTEYRKDKGQQTVPVSYLQCNDGAIQTIMVKLARMLFASLILKLQQATLMKHKWNFSYNIGYFGEKRRSDHSENKL